MKLTASSGFSNVLLAILFLLNISLVSGQQAAPPKQPLAEDVFKNIKALRGITASEFMETMGFFSASLGANCNYCHVGESGGDWSKYADDSVPQKRTARGMVAMVATMNKQFFGGRRVLTCYSCHRGADHPKVIPNLDELYADPSQEPTDAFLEQEPKKISADQVLDKYLQALGGVQKLNAITSYVGKGTYGGYDTPKVPFDIYAKAPNQRAAIVHTPNGDSSNVFDGRNAWVAAPATDRPITLLTLEGKALDAAKVDGDMLFPARIKQMFTEWKVGFPYILNDRDTLVLEGSGGGRGPVRFYFDKETGLLTRLVRYVDTVVGLSPTRYDFSDYREIAGVKMPYKWNVTWLDGRGSVELTDLQVNVPVDASKFAKPATPK